MPSTLARRCTLVAVAALAVVGLWLFFAQSTDLDTSVMDNLRDSTPQPLKDLLRPFRPPEVLAFEPKDFVIQPTSPLTVTFLTSMLPTEDTIEINPPMKGTWQWKGNQAVFSPAEEWPRDAWYTVTVSRDVRSWLGRRADSDTHWSFSVIEPPMIRETYPVQGARFADYAHSARLYFNEPMDCESIESRFSVTPSLDNLGVDCYGRSLYIQGDWQPSTEYHLRLARGSHDRYGYEITDDFDWSFTTTSKSSGLAIANIGHFGIVPAGSPSTLKLKTRNVTSVDVRLYRLGEEQFRDMLHWRSYEWRDSYYGWYSPSGSSLADWNVPLPINIDQYVVQDLPVQSLQPGVYWLDLQTPEGVSDNQVIVATNTALTMKRSADEVLVWATDLRDGSPVTGLVLAFYDDEGKQVGAGVTDQLGLFQGSIQNAPQALDVIGGKGREFVALSSDWDQNIEAWRFENVTSEWSERAQTKRTYVYTDRPIYRPGQTINFKGIVRNEDDAVYAPPPAGASVHVTLSDRDKRVLYDKTLSTNLFGSFADLYPLSSEAGLGTYLLTAHVGDNEYKTEIYVEEYRKPEYSATIALDRGEYISGETITATVRAQYLFGGPVANAAVHWTLYASNYVFGRVSGYDFASAAENGYAGYGREISSNDAALDSRGELVLVLPANLSAEGYSQQYTLEVTVTDASNQPQSALAVAPIHRGAFYIGLHPAAYVGSKGEVMRFDAISVDAHGKPIGQTPLAYSLKRLTWSCGYIQNDEGQRVARCRQSEMPVTTGSLVTDASGQSHLRLTPSEGGTYYLDAQGQDARGNRILGRTTVYVTDESKFVGWELENNDRLKLVLDKKSYAVGDTAQVLVQSPYDKATALLTIERGKILSHQIVELNSNSAVLSVPVLDLYYPDAYVGLTLIPRSTQSVDQFPGFKIGLAQLEVASDAKRLNVRVQASKPHYEPGEQAVYSIKTSDVNGKPVSAEVSLGVVDKAIYELKGDYGADVWNAFYGVRPLGVQTSQSLTVLLTRVNTREDIGGGGGVSDALRSAFFDVAYWDPAILTDKNGEATVRVSMPDNLTTWVASAIGMTASTQVGQGDVETVVAKELLVRPVLPRFLTVGDEATIGALVHNYGAATRSVTVTLAATSLDLPNDLTRRITIDAGQSAEVDWPIRVPGIDSLSASFAPTATIPLSATIAIRARAADASDGVQLVVPIQAFGEKHIVENAGTVDAAGSTFSFAVPQGAGLASIRISTSPTLAASMVDSLEYLTGYPYGCTEQTMSRFLPDVLVKQALGKLQLKNDKLEKELPKQVEAGLTRLYGFQHEDGGWGWWQWDASQPYQSAYVLYGLVQAKQAGYAVDSETIYRGLDYLRKWLVETPNDDVKVYIAYVMTEAGGQAEPYFPGSGGASMARVLFGRREGLSLYSRALLAIMLHKNGETDMAQTVVSELEKQAIESEQAAHWVESPAEKARGDHYDSDGRTTATILRALLLVDPNSRLVPKTVSHLMDHRSGGYWGTTQETATTLIALTDYLVFTGELNPNMSYEVFLDDARVLSQSVTRPDTTSPGVILRVGEGSHSVRLVMNGKGRVYYGSTLQYYVPASSIPSTQSESGYSIEREYLDPKTGLPVQTFQLGDTVRVNLTVELPRDGWYMMITDPLPAGFEAINSSLATSPIASRVVNQNNSYELPVDSPEDGANLSGMQVPMIVQPELHDDRAIFFVTHLPTGSYSFSYLMRATTSGTFRALPAEMTPMYQPAVFARSASVSTAIRTR